MPETNIPQNNDQNNNIFPESPTAGPNIVSPSPRTNLGADYMAFFRDNKWAIVIIFVSIIAIVLASFFAFRNSGTNAPTQPKITISIEAPQKLASGAEVVYKMQVKNNDVAAIKNITVDLSYPQGFSFTDSTPKPTKLNGTQFGLPTLDPGQDVTVMIKGNLLGNAGENKTVSAIMHYKYSTVNADYIAQAQAITQIMSADLTLQFDGSTSVNPNQDTTYILNYANYTDKTISGFRITIDIPQSFKVSSTVPAPNFGSTWTLGQLDPNASGKIVLNGNFKDAKIGDQASFLAKAEGSVDERPSFVLSSMQYPVTIAQVPLESSISLQSNNSGVVSAGETLNYKVTYKNNGSQSAKGVNIAVKLIGEAYDLESITATGANVNGDTISWDASQNSALDSVGAGLGGDLNFTVKVKNPATRGTSTNLTLNAHAEIRSSDYSQPFLSGENVAKVQTFVTVSKAVSFSSGANPPTVGQSTTYLVVVGLKNETNDVTDAKVVFNLPNAVNFDKNTINSDEQANVTYDSSSKKITWTVTKLAAHAGSFVPQRKLQFNVTINPGVNLRGQSVSLLSNIKFTGTDSFTSKAISLNIDPLKTSDEPSGQGSVK